MSKPKYRIITKFPCYNGVFPITGYFVQRLEEGFFTVLKELERIRKFSKNITKKIKTNRI